MNPHSPNGFVEVETREHVVIARLTQEVNLSGQMAEVVAEQLLRGS